jgi:hypothetical protein
MTEQGVTAWEYMYLYIEGHKAMLHTASTMVVTTSDGRWSQEKLPRTAATIVAVLNELGREGWEMVNSSGNGGTFTPATPSVHAMTFEAMFKRPRRADG